MEDLKGLVIAEHVLAVPDEVAAMAAAAAIAGHFVDVRDLV